MPVPKKIKVGPFDLKTEHNIQRLKDVEGDAALFAREGKVILDLSQEESYLRDSVLHELLHACYRQTNLYKSGEEAHSNEEELVAALTPRILSLLRDNPGLVTYLTEKE